MIEIIQALKHEQTDGQTNGVNEQTGKGKERIKESDFEVYETKKAQLCKNEFTKKNNLTFIELGTVIDK